MGRPPPFDQLRIRRVRERDDASQLALEARRTLEECEAALHRASLEESSARRQAEQKMFEERSGLVSRATVADMSRLSTFEAAQDETLGRLTEAVRIATQRLERARVEEAKRRTELVAAHKSLEAVERARAAAAVEVERNEQERVDDTHAAAAAARRL